MKKNTKILIYIIGNNQAGGAQHSFIKEAQIVSNKNNKVYFISAGKTSFETCKLIERYNLSLIEANILLNKNPITLTKYLIFLNRAIKKIKNENNPNYVISCSYTTPLSSILATICCLFNNIRERRYRVGGLLFNENLKKYQLFFAYLIEFFLLRFNKYITFVSDTNKYSYLKNYKFLKKRAKYIDVIYSLCTDKHLENNIELKLKYQNIFKFNKLEDYNNKKNFIKINLDKIIENKNIVLTICNDKPSKGSKVFYKLAFNNNNKSIFFIHLGSRTYKKPILIANNLLIIPHCNHNEIFKWLELCDISILLSTYLEGLAQVIPQSLSLSKPVIAFQNSGIQDCIINNYNGLIFDPSTNINIINQKLDELFIIGKIRNITSNAEEISKFFFIRHSEENFKNVIMETNFYKNIIKV